MLKLDLPEELDHLLSRFAKELGIAKEELAIRAIKDRIEDMEDLAVAEAVLAKDDGKRIPLSDIMAEFGDDPDGDGSSLHAAE